MEKKKKRFYFIPFIILAVVALVGLIVMLLWNHIVAEVFNIKPISYGQAVGLFILCKILFSSFRPGPPAGFRKGGGHWRNKLMNMTPEEREAMKAEWRRRFHPKDPS